MREKGNCSTFFLTIGEMHASVLIGEDGFRTIARGGATAQGACVTSACSST